MQLSEGLLELFLSIDFTDLSLGFGIPMMISQIASGDTARYGVSISALLF